MKPTTLAIVSGGILVAFFLAGAVAAFYAPVAASLVCVVAAGSFAIATRKEVQRIQRLDEARAIVRRLARQGLATGVLTVDQAREKANGHDHRENVGQYL